MVILTNQPSSMRKKPPTGGFERVVIADTKTAIFVCIAHETRTRR